MTHSLHRPKPLFIISLVALATAAVLTGASPSLARAACSGDCNGDGTVMVDDLVTMVTFALDGGKPLSTCVTGCAAGDANQDSQITIDDIVIAVNNALNNCPASAAEEEGLQWLAAQQDDGTGLLPSTEDQDSLASTYNNALAVMVFTLKKDVPKAKHILEFYKNRLNAEFFVGAQGRGFFQYRDSHTGSPPASDPNHSARWMGDNAWLCLAIADYETATQDYDTYHNMALAIVEFLKGIQEEPVLGQPWRYIASGWKNGDTVFDHSYSIDGNLDAYKCLLRYGETQLAMDVKNWLDYVAQPTSTASPSICEDPAANECGFPFNWQAGPLDHHTWRVLSLGGDYGFCLQDLERTDRDELRYQWTVAYEGTRVTGFTDSGAAVCPCHKNDVWSEGTGQAAVSFYKAGCPALGNVYAGELEKLAFDSPKYPGTKTIPFWALRDGGKQGHVAGVGWYIFAKNKFDPFDGKVMDSYQARDPVARIQAENYDRDRSGCTVPTGEGCVRPDDRGHDKGIIFEGRAIHIAGDHGSNSPIDSSGWTEYTFNLLSTLASASVRVRYADDEAGDTCTILLDGQKIDAFDTRDTATDGSSQSGWDTYVWSAPFEIREAALRSYGRHTLRIEGKDNSHFGFTVDSIEIRQGAEVE